jgi:hypothetical protein
MNTSLIRALATFQQMGGLAEFVDGLFAEMGKYLPKPAWPLQWRHWKLGYPRVLWVRPQINLPLQINKAWLEPSRNMRRKESFPCPEGKQCTPYFWNIGCEASRGGHCVTLQPYQWLAPLSWPMIHFLFLPTCVLCNSLHIGSYLPWVASETNVLIRIHQSKCFGRVCPVLTGGWNPDICVGQHFYLCSDSLGNCFTNLQMDMLPMFDRLFLLLCMEKTTEDYHTHICCTSPSWCHVVKCKKGLLQNPTL